MADSLSPLSGAMLLAVDLQPTLLQVIPHKDDVLKRCSFAVEAARVLGLPTGFTEQVPQKLGSTHPDLLALAENPHVFSKSTFSALGDDGILDALRTLQVEHLLLCGVETSICVYQTALDALNAHFQVTILVDGVGCRRPADGEACLQTLAKAGAHLLPSETVFYSVLGGAQHASFRAFTQIVKKYA